MVKMIDVIDATRKLHCSRISVYRYIAKGLIPANRIGGEYFIRESDLENIKVRKPGRPRKSM